MSDAAACDDSANIAHASTECESHSPRARLGPTLSDRKAWHLPVLLITSQLLLAQLWHRSQPASSVLLVLVMYAPLLVAGALWTEWFQLDYATIAAAAGVSRRSVANAFNALRSLGLIETRRVRSLVDPRHTPQQYRVSARLYHKRGEPFARIFAAVVTSGEWAAMGQGGTKHSAAARHLWLATRALDPVRDASALAAKLTDDHVDESEAAARIAEMRGAAPGSLRVLSYYTGLKPETVRWVRREVFGHARLAA